jgi:hypothetical protein
MNLFLTFVKVMQVGSAIVIFSIFGVMFLMSIAMLVGKSQKKNYERDISFIESCIDHWVVNENTYMQIKAMFSDIDTNDHDHTRTVTAYKKFLRRYDKFEISEPFDVWTRLSVTQN